MLTDDELNEIKRDINTWGCTSCRTHLEKLMSGLTYYKNLSEIYKGDVIEMAMEYRKVKSTIVE